MEQSYLILEQESSLVFLLRAGKGSLESHESNVHRQNHVCVTTHHQGVETGDRSGIESTSTTPDTSLAWWHPQACSIGQRGPKAARTDSKGVALLQCTSHQSVRNGFAFEFRFLLELLLWTQTHGTVSSMDTAGVHLCISRCKGHSCTVTLPGVCHGKLPTTDWFS